MLGRALAIPGRPCGPPRIPPHPGTTGGPHSVCCKHLSGPAALSLWKLFLTFPDAAACRLPSSSAVPSPATVQTSLDSGALTRPCPLSEVSSPWVCVPPSVPSSELEPQITECMLAFCTWYLSDR